MIVTVDGPAGAGKSTVARLLADRLGFRYVDTGAMYRALTWLALERGVELADGEALAALARESPVTLGAGRVSIAGFDVTGAIRASRIDGAVSSVARHEQVRRVMRADQRELAAAGNVVIEGRDIGTVVCPDAEVKVFLVADPRERARRRSPERPDVAAEALADDLATRDARDAAQLRTAPDAVTIDTTELAVHEVVARIERLVVAQAGR